MKFFVFSPPTMIVEPSGIVTWLSIASLFRGGGSSVPPCVTASPVKLLSDTLYSSCR